MISAKIVADSLSPQGHRLTTFVLTFPRIILAELNTHRMFSRNSASSRAIPFEKMVKAVQDNPFIPIAWQKDHKGMQGTEYFNKDESQAHINWWLKARDHAVMCAKALQSEHTPGKVTKQICNRLLEPFMWHTVILTTSEEGLENFFKQRCPQYHSPVDNEFRHRSKKDCYNAHSNPENLKLMDNFTVTDWLKINEGQSEIHMMALAECMWDAYNESTPKQLQAGGWHIPFFEDIDMAELAIEVAGEPSQIINDSDSTSVRYELPFKDFLNGAIKVSAARNARVSYTVVGEDKEYSIKDNIQLHDRLIDMYHMSPLEHIAKAMSDEEYENFGKMHHISFSKVSNWAMPEVKGELIEGWCNNLQGFIPYRYIVENKL